MMKRVTATTVVLSTLLVAGLSPALIAETVPLYGDLDLQPCKVWQIEAAGEALFSRIYSVHAMADRVYIYDRKNLRVYIVSAEGKPLGAFGKRGEGPGEMLELHMAQMFLVEGKIVMAEHGRLHFFDKDGNFLYRKQIPLNRPPLLFLNENEYITAPTIMRQAPSGHGAIRRCRLDEKKESLLYEFDLFKGGYVDRPNGKRTYYSITTLIPMMVVGHDNDRLFFGMNNRYLIHVSDLAGRFTGRIELDRKAEAVSRQEIEEMLIKPGRQYFQTEMMRRLARTLPDHINQFSKISIHNGFVFVFALEKNAGNIQRIDIFSRDGRYLYNARLTINADDTIAKVPVIHGDSAYIVQSNDEGEQSMARYRITLPDRETPPANP